MLSFIFMIGCFLFEWKRNCTSFFFACLYMYMYICIAIDSIIKMWRVGVPLTCQTFSTCPKSGPGFLSVCWVFNDLRWAVVVLSRICRRFLFFVYISVCLLLLEIQLSRERERVGIPLTALTLSYLCACPQPGPRFLLTYSLFSSQWFEVRGRVIIPVVDLGGIAYY